MGDALGSRGLWEVFEPIHAVVYFAPEVIERYRAAGLRGFWMGYFASRSLPLGAAPPELVTATFFGFHPAMVNRALPDAWQLASPQAVAAARSAGVVEALGRLLGDAGSDQAIAEAAALTERAARACSSDGRALFAAHRALEWPEGSLLRLWHAATLLREHRGDGHVAANVAAGISGLAAHVLFSAAGGVPRSGLQPHRGWSDEDWDSCDAELHERGWLTDGQLSEDGRQVRRWVEDRTDTLAEEPWRRVGDRVTARVLELLGPLAARIIDAGGIPMPNPMGVPRPTRVEPNR